MRFVIQRVQHASVSVDNEVIGKIGRGYMVLVGVSDADDEAVADKMVDKMIKLRINEDAEGKTNLSLADVDGGLLMISQFTLYANCRKGNRPSFTGAGSPEKANALYEYILDRCRQSVPVVEKGSFGAHMAVELVNDGPFTIILDSDTLAQPRS
jgi:D-tyrosyl-tRNA(Tyr) deacylase